MTARLNATHTSPAVLVHVSPSTDAEARVVRVTTADPTTSAEDKARDLIPAAQTLAALGNAPDWWGRVRVVIEVLARCTDVHTHDLLTHIGDGTSRRRRRANPNRADQPEWMWWALALDPDDGVRRACATTCPEHLANGPLGEMLLAEPTTAASTGGRMHNQAAVIRRAFDADTRDGLIYVANNHSATDQDLMAVVDRGIADEALMLQLCNRALPEAVARRLAAHGSDEVLARMVSRSWCPDDLVEAARSHPDRDIAKTAWSRGWEAFPRPQRHGPDWDAFYAAYQDWASANPAT